MDYKDRIIDGINVAKCQHYMSVIEKDVCNCGRYELTMRYHCYDNPNCYFKQLQRKKSNCTECENETMLKYSDLMIEYDKIKQQNKMLNDCLDTQHRLCQSLMESNLRYKNELYLEEIKKLEGKSNGAKNTRIN